MTATFKFNRWLVRRDVEQLGPIQLVKFRRTWLARLLRIRGHVRVSGVVDAQVVRVQLAEGVNGYFDAVLISRQSRINVD